MTDIIAACNSPVQRLVCFRLHGRHSSTLPWVWPAFGGQVLLLTQLLRQEFKRGRLMNTNERKVLASGPPAALCSKSFLLAELRLGNATNRPFRTGPLALSNVSLGNKRRCFKQLLPSSFFQQDLWFHSVKPRLFRSVVLPTPSVLRTGTSGCILGNFRLHPLRRPALLYGTSPAALAKLTGLFLETRLFLTWTSLADTVHP